MFTLVFLLLIASITYAAIHNWIQYTFLPSQFFQKTLKKAEQHISLENWEDAWKLIEPLLKKPKAQKQASLLHIQYLLGKNCCEEALEKALFAMREFPEELLFRLEEAKILLKMGRPEKAMEAFHVCAPILHTESDLLKLAMAYQHSEYYEKCLEILRPWIKTSESFDVYAVAGDAYFGLKNFPMAIECYKRCLEMGGKKHQVFIQLALSYKRFGNLSEAENIFVKLLEIDTLDIQATLGLGECYQERGHYHRALFVYQSSELWDIKNDLVIKDAALAAFYAKKYAFAAQYFAKTMKNEEPEAKIYVLYGYCLERLKKWPEAECVYLEMIKTYPNDPQGFLSLAWLYGVGLSTTLTKENGLYYANKALNLKNDLLSWEILSAVEARSGCYEKALQIQQGLIPYDNDRHIRQRRIASLRTLRKNRPLDEGHVNKSEVA